MKDLDQSLPIKRDLRKGRFALGIWKPADVKADTVRHIRTVNRLRKSVRCQRVCLRECLIPVKAAVPQHSTMSSPVGPSTAECDTAASTESGYRTRIETRITCREQDNINMPRFAGRRYLFDLRRESPCNSSMASSIFQLTVCCLNMLNARSVRYKALAISDYIDLVALTETWLRTSADGDVIHDLVSSGYKILHVPRPGTRPGEGESE